MILSPSIRGSGYRRRSSDRRAEGRSRSRSSAMRGCVRRNTGATRGRLSPRRPANTSAAGRALLIVKSDHAATGSTSTDDEIPVETWSSPTTRQQPHHVILPRLARRLRRPKTASCGNLGRRHDGRRPLPPRSLGIREQAGARVPTIIAAPPRSSPRMALMVNNLGGTPMELAIVAQACQVPWKSQLIGSLGLEMAGVSLSVLLDDAHLARLRPDRRPRPGLMPRSPPSPRRPLPADPAAETTGGPRPSALEADLGAQQC